MNTPRLSRVRPIVGCAVLLFAAHAVNAQSFSYVHGGVGFRSEALDDNNAWFSFDGGVIRRTTDGGATITNVTVPDNIRGTLRGFHIETDAMGTYGYCVGDDGVVLFSSDGGSTWTEKTRVVTSATHPFSPNVEPQLWDVWFEDRMHGYVVGFENTIQETTDGGTSWSDLSPSGHIAADNPEWYQLHAFAPNEFVAVADEGWVARVVNGLTAPSLIHSGLWCYPTQISTTPPFDMELWSVDFVGDVGVAAGGIGNNDGYIFRSTDRGQTWALDTACYDFLNAGAGGNTPPSFYGVELFDDPDTGAAVGYGSTCFQGGPSSSGTTVTGTGPMCGQCTMGGKTWTQVVCDSDQNMVVDPTDDKGAPLLRDICTSPSFATTYALGDFGLVRRSDDRGFTWSELAGLHRGRIATGAFSDMSTGVIGGQLWRGYATSDGGQNFSLDVTLVNPTGQNGEFRASAIGSTGQRALLCGDRGRIAVRDSTGTWSQQSIGTWTNGPRLNGALAVGAGTAMVVVGQRFQNQTMWISLDGGATPFVGYTVMLGGNPVVTALADVALDGRFLLLLTANHDVLVIDTTVSLNDVAYVFTLTPGTIPAAGSAATELGMRSVVDLYIGNDAGEVFQLNPSLTMDRVTGIAQTDLGGECLDIEPAPGSSEWWFTGRSGNAVRFDGTSFSTPKTAIAQDIWSAQFFSAQDGLLIGRKTNVSVW